MYQNVVLAVKVVLAVNSKVYTVILIITVLNVTERFEFYTITSQLQVKL